MQRVESCKLFVFSAYAEVVPDSSSAREAAGRILRVRGGSSLVRPVCGPPGVYSPRAWRSQ